MGNQIPPHKLEKDFDKFEDSSIEISSCSMQGWRNEMEDKHIITKLDGLSGHYIFGVFDGHGGDLCANYISFVFCHKFMENPHFLIYNLKFSSSDIERKEVYELYNECLVKALTETCFEIDEDFKRIHYTRGNNKSGTTMNLILITPYFIFCVNVGDSRSVLGTNRVSEIIFSKQTGYIEEIIPFQEYDNSSEESEVLTIKFPIINTDDTPTVNTDKRLHVPIILNLDTNDIVHISKDHKPSDIEEYDRINKSGSFVVNGRVNGILALSRAFGDFDFKLSCTSPNKTAVTCAPHITVTSRQTTDDYIVCACDGLWDVMSSEEVITYIRRTELCCLNLEELSSYLVDEAFHRHSTDNISVIICRLK